MEDATTITVKAETWRSLNRRKSPGESFDDVVSRLLAETGGEAP